nr:MAG TPA: chitin synthase regulator [Caudoviricetes sp.]
MWLRLFCFLNFRILKIRFFVLFLTQFFLFFFYIGENAKERRHVEPKPLRCVIVPQA